MPEDYLCYKMLYKYSAFLSFPYIITNLQVVSTEMFAIQTLNNRVRQTLKKLFLFPCSIVTLLMQGEKCSDLTCVIYSAFCISIIIKIG